MCYDTRCYFNVRSKADISQLNLPHAIFRYINLLTRSRELSGTSCCQQVSYFVNKNDVVLCN